MLNWNASPEIVSIGPLSLRWYGLLFATSFFCGYRICGRIYSRAGLSLASLDRFFVYMFVGTLVGARLGHCLFYEPEIYLSEPLRIFKIWEGGLASHGAAIGIILALFLYSRAERRLAGAKGTRITPLFALDCATRGVALSGFFIRLGNFFNSEIIGRPTTVPWAVVFQRIDRIPRHPSQLYESFTYLTIYFVLTAISRRSTTRLGSGLLFGIFLLLVFMTRFFLEFLKENQVAFESSLPMNMGQLLSIPLILLGSYFIARGIKNQRSGFSSKEI